MSSPSSGRAALTAGLVAVASLGCHSQPARCGADVAPRWSDTAAAAYQFHAALTPDAEQLCVEARYPAGQRTIGLLPVLRRFVRDVEVEQDGVYHPVAWTRLGLALPACPAPGCHVRYRFLLGAATRYAADRDLAFEHEGTRLAPPSSWLLHPMAHATPGRFRLRMSVPEGLTFATGLAPLAGSAGIYEGDAEDLGSLPYSAFGRLVITPVSVLGADVEIAFAPGAAPRERIAGWVGRAAGTLAAYYGRFPAKRLLVLVLPETGDNVGGSTMGGSGASVMLSVGSDVTDARLADDWILAHELVHVAFPNVGKPWVEEGIATYAEPIMRARAGGLAVDRVWRDLIEGLPNGLPEAGDRGLDHTDTWGRRYWGGALFWLLADVGIRRATGNTRSLDDVLRAVITEGGDVSATWSFTRVIDVGDRATGTTVLRDLYATMSDAPAPVELDALFAELGVRLDGEVVVYDEAAPLAAIRRSITGLAASAR